MPDHTSANNNKQQHQHQQKQQQRKIRRSRRSSQQQQEQIIAPGFGTAKDLKRLARDLSEGQTESISVEVVQAMMESHGRGIRSRRSTNNNDATTAAATPVNTAWADFMKEEGVTTQKEPPKQQEKSTTGRSKRGKKSETTEATEAASASNDVNYRVYDLDKLQAKSLSTTTKNKKFKGEQIIGVLVQTGTLNSAVVGRSKKIDVNEPYSLMVPTKILPNIQIQSVYTAGHACHSIAIGIDGSCYGWGRNENQQLSSHLPANNVYQPTLIEDLIGPVRMAGVGKSHTILLLDNGDVYSSGLNKSGQCGIKSSIEQVPNFRKASFPDDMDSTIIQVACGEDFSVAVCDLGYMYSTGSSEFGQLGNGETGEYFIAANKLGFANETSFKKRTTFCHAPSEKLHSLGGDNKAKVIPMNEDIRIQQVACGKHHALALEAESEGNHVPRVFTWGCGNFGVLGHGKQADEYFPRLVGSLATMPLPMTGPSTMSVSAGQHCSMLQTCNGHVYYWGKHRPVGEATMRPTLVDALANNQHIVTHVAGGGQTVVCCTANAQTVAWGQGQHGELGLSANKKSSAKPTFVDGINGCRIASLSCGYGHTLFVVRNEDKEDKEAVQKLPELDPDATEGLE